MLEQTESQSPEQKDSTFQWSNFEAPSRSNNRLVERVQGRALNPEARAKSKLKMNEIIDNEQQSRTVADELRGRFPRHLANLKLTEQEDNTLPTESVEEKVQEETKIEGEI